MKTNKIHNNITRLQKQHNKCVFIRSFVFIVVVVILLLFLIKLNFNNRITNEKNDSTAQDTEVINELTAYTVQNLTEPFVEIVEESVITETISETQTVEKVSPVIEEVIEEQQYREDVFLDANLQTVLYSACEDNNIDYTLVLGLIEHESHFNPKAVSSAKCYGLMQLNPVYFPSNLSYEDNIRYGVKYLRDCLDRYDNNVKAALRAYNAGHDDGAREYSNTVIEYAKKYGYNG